MCARTATRCSPGPLRPTPAVRSCYVQALTRKYVVHTVFRKGGFFSPVGMAAATFPGCKARGGALPLAAVPAVESLAVALQAGATVWHCGTTRPWSYEAMWRWGYGTACKWERQNGSMGPWG